MEKQAFSNMSSIFYADGLPTGKCKCIPLSACFGFVRLGQCYPRGLQEQTNNGKSAFK